MSQRKLKTRTDRRHWLDCLDDPTLLERAILDRNTWLVPVGGKRRGGYTAVSGAKHARELMARMAEHGGFPNARYVSGGRNYPPRVHWGEPEPALPPSARSEYDLAASDVADGRHYGYSEKAILDYLTEQYDQEIVRQVLGRFE